MITNIIFQTFILLNSTYFVKKNYFLKNIKTMLGAQKLFVKKYGFNNYYSSYAHH